MSKDGKIDGLDRDFLRLCTATGALFLAFARLEGALSASLRLHLSFAVLNDEKFSALDYSSAVFGSMRYTVARDIMRKTMCAVGETPNTLELFESFHQHIGHISTLRNKLTHQSVSIDPRRKSGWIIDDLLTTRVTSARVEFAITTTDVMNAAEDLETALTWNKHFLRHAASTLEPPTDLPVWKYDHRSLKRIRRTRSGDLPKL